VNSQEREIISGIFQRLEQAASQPRDPESERFIGDKIRQQPYAPYAMAQLIYVQEEAIKSLSQQIEELRAEVERSRSPSPSPSGRAGRRGAASRSPGRATRRKPVTHPRAATLRRAVPGEAASSPA
jgi:hypothetical protein